MEEDDDYNIPNYGVWLDIFPIDFVPDPNSLLGKIHMIFVRISIDLARKRAISDDHANTKRGIKRIIWLAGHSIISIFPVEFYNRLVNEILTYFNDKSCKYVAEGNFYWKSPKRSFPSQMFDSYMNIEFENLNVRCISDFDLYLKNTYGNYMKLPAVSERNSNHHYRAFWKQQEDIS